MERNVTERNAISAPLIRHGGDKGGVDQPSTVNNRPGPPPLKGGGTGATVATEKEARERIEFLKGNFPEAAAAIADLYRLGMIPGLRALEYAGPPRCAAPAAGAITLADVLLDCDKPTVGKRP